MRASALKQSVDLVDGAQLVTEEQFVELARRAYRVAMHLGHRQGFGTAEDFADALLDDVQGVLRVAFAGRGVRAYADLAQDYQLYLANIRYPQGVGL